MKLITGHGENGGELNPIALVSRITTISKMAETGIQVIFIHTLVGIAERNSEYDAKDSHFLPG